MRYKTIFLIFTTALILFSCDKAAENNHPKKQSAEVKTKSDNEEQNEIILGEDIPEINAYVKNIYEKNGKFYVELDLVEIKYKNVDERMIVNKNPKVRTYVIDDHTLIYSNDCKELIVKQLLQARKKLLKNKSIIVVGTSKDGRMKNINFGCYG
ncbi:MAG: hypothetical protein E2600_11770 [Chryseobacterium sp.]|nr:hypothetical protein [Chryseobacterium sp.]